MKKRSELKSTSFATTAFLPVMMMSQSCEPKLFVNGDELGYKTGSNGTPSLPAMKLPRSTDIPVRVPSAFRIVRVPLFPFMPTRNLPVGAISMFMLVSNSRGALQDRVLDSLACGD